jgi:hypothetical protein
VGGELRYTLDGIDYSVDLFPDSIWVAPDPQLVRVATEEPGWGYYYAQFLNTLACHPNLRSLTDTSIDPLFINSISTTFCKTTSPAMILSRRM